MDLSVAPQTEESALTLPLSRGQLVAALEETAQKLAECDLRLKSDTVNEARALRDSLLIQLRDQLLPKLHDADTPALVVIGGSTGAGKSTLVNSIFEQELSEAGILRPTTRTPVLVAHPEDVPALRDHPLTTAVRTVTSEIIPPGLSVIDASDLDSVSETNRALALRLLDAADLWVFVTSAARYGDAAPWQILEMAKEHGTAIAVVLNRVPQKSLSEVRKDLLTRLSEMNLGEAPFFVIPDLGPHEGLLPAELVAEMRQWLIMMAGRHRAAGLLRRAEKKSWRWLADKLLQMADYIDTQSSAVEAFDQQRMRVLHTPYAEIETDLAQGNCAQGAPVSRWQALGEKGGPLVGIEQTKPLRKGLFKRRQKKRGAALVQVARDCRSALETRVAAALSSTQKDVNALWKRSGIKNETDLGAESASVLLTQWEQGLTLPDAVPAGLDESGVKNLLLAAVTGVPGAQKACLARGLKTELASGNSELATLIKQAIDAGMPASSTQSLLPDPQLSAVLRQRSQNIEVLIRSGADHD